MSSKPKKKTKVWGFTGGIASGKSSAVKFFQKKGIPCIEADQIGKELFEKKEVQKFYQDTFQTLDRNQIREKLHKNPDLKKVTESFIHPLVTKESHKRIDALKKSGDHAFILYVSALLIEAGRTEEFDGIVGIRCDLESQIKRIQKRDHVDRALAQKLIANQTSAENRQDFVDYWIENNDSLESLETQIDTLIDTLSSLQKL